MHNIESYSRLKISNKYHKPITIGVMSRFRLLFFSTFMAIILLPNSLNANCFLSLANLGVKSLGWRENSWTTSRLHWDRVNPDASYESETKYALYSKSLRLSSPSDAHKDGVKIQLMITDVVSDSQNLRNGVIEVRIDSNSKIKFKNLSKEDKHRLTEILAAAATKTAKLINSKEGEEVKTVKIVLGSNVKDIARSDLFVGKKFRGDPLGKGEEFDEAPIAGFMTGAFVTALSGAVQTLHSGLGAGYEAVKTIAIPAIAGGVGIFETIRIVSHYKNRDFSIELPVEKQPPN